MRLNLTHQVAFGYEVCISRSCHCSFHAHLISNSGNQAMLLSRHHAYSWEMPRL